MLGYRQGTVLRKEIKESRNEKETPKARFKDSYTDRNRERLMKKGPSDQNLVGGCEHEGGDPLEI